MNSALGLTLQIATLVVLVGGLVSAYLALRRSKKGKIKVENEWRGEVDSDRKQFREFMAEVRKDLREIREEMVDILRRLPPRFVVPGSPLSLTDLGRDVADEMSASTSAIQPAELFKQEVEGREDYEIQDSCIDYTNNQLSV